MLKPKVVVGECSLHVVVRGVMLMTIPHRMWESRVDERGEVVWSGEWRGDHTTVLLARYVEGKVQGCKDQEELFDRLEGILQELRFPKWSKSFREEELQKKKRNQEREVRDRDREAPEGEEPVAAWRVAA